MTTSQEIDPSLIPLDPEETEMQVPLSGTVDDNDDTDDEHEDENDAPERALSDETDTRGEFRLDEREEDDDSSVDDDDEDEDEDDVESA
jgi:hypothetical protein